ncbi:MAG: heliorhodopsin HeR [Eubacteriales bacterium]|nr:heliorhodopsin HeR [Eubacteriales bacterium]
MKKEITIQSLRKFNLRMGILHFLQGTLMLVFALAIDKIANFRTPVMSYFLTFDTQKMRLVTEQNKVGDLPFAILVAVFLFMSAIAHFIIVMPKTNEIYNKDLAKRINRFRWYEYALSSSVMIVLIAQLFGVYDIGALIAIFVVNASMNLFGMLMEEINQYKEKLDWKPFIFGSIAGIAPWVVILLYAFGNSDLSQVPWFAYAIVGSYFVFFNLFPINMILQYKRIGKWSNYMYGERVYITLSLVAKSVLAWLVFFGVMQPN